MRGGFTYIAMTFSFEAPSPNLTAVVLSMRIAKLVYPHV